MVCFSLTKHPQHCSKYISFLSCWPTTCAAQWVSGLFVPRTIRILDYSYYGRTIHTLDDSYDGLFVRWTIRTMDFSYHGLFVPFTNITYANKANVLCVSVCLIVNIVYMYWSDISVTDYQCSLSIFRANKRVHSVGSLLPCWTQYFSRSTHW